MKDKFFLIILYFFAMQGVFAQIDYVLAKDQYIVLDNVNVLIDKNYSFQDILHNNNLKFTKKTKISVIGLDFYWIKYSVQNNSAYDKKYSVWSSPKFDTKLFFFDEDGKNWKFIKGGELVSNNRNFNKYMTCIFKSQKTTTFYLKINVSQINTEVQLLKPTIALENNEITVANRNQEYNWWLVTVSVVLSFLIYNAYWYLMIKEKVYFYYLIILAAGIVYITCVPFFISLFTDFKSINATINLNGKVDYIPIELIIIKLATIAVIYGFIQFTRTYLQTKLSLPKWDLFLKFKLLFFVIFNLTLTSIEFFKITKTYDIYSILSNYVLLIVIGSIILVGFKSYILKIKESYYFLLSLALPLLIMLTLVIKLIFSPENSGLNILPNLAILSITISFAIALMAKVNIIKEELVIEKLEKQSIAASIAIEKQINIRLEEKIEYNKNEVAAAQHIKLLMKELQHRVKNNLQIVSSLLSLQSYRIKDKAAIEAVKEAQRRIEAMSLIHQRLYIQDNITQVNIKEFISDIAESLMQAYGYNNHNFNLQINLSTQFLEVDKAIPLSIIINELITNAFKYAYVKTENPKLTISFTKQLENIELSIIDNGIGLNTESWKNNDGYGKELVNTFTEQLEGKLSLIVDNGTTFKIMFPF